jgi:hypothetical protein
MITPEVKIFLQKVAEFTKIALNEIESKDRLIYGFKKEAAADLIKEARYEDSLEKAADALYNLDFITDKYERREFLKKAKQDPSYLASMLIKVCDASDVASIGSPARVTKIKQAEDYDPVMEKAFGRNYRRVSILEE